MDPVTIGAVILASIAVIGATVANIRVRSKCRAGENLELSFQKRFNEDIGEPRRKHNTSSDYDDDD